MRRTVITITCNLLFALMLSTGVNAEAMGTVNDNVFYQLGNASAFMAGTRADATLTIDSIPFSYKITDGGLSGDTISEVKARVLIKHDLLDTVRVTPDASCWAASRQVLFGRGTTYDTLSIRFYNGSTTSFSNYDTLFWIVLQPKVCQLEFDHDSVLFTADNDFNEVAFNLAGDLSPNSSNRALGYIEIEDYTSQITAPTLVVSGKIMDTIVVPVLATSNFKTPSAYVWFKYDNTKLTVLTRGVRSPVFNNSFVGAELRGDTAISMYTSGVAKEMSNDTLFTIKMVPKSTLTQGSTDLTFISGADKGLADACYIYHGTTYTNGSITLHDSAVYRAYLPTAATVGKSAGATIRYNIQMKNTFAVGVQTGESIGMTAAVNTGTLSFKYQDTIPMFAGADWGISQNGTRDQFVIRQRATGVDTIPTSASFVDMLGVNFEWVPGSHTANWNSQYLRPNFVYTYDLYDTSSAPSVRDTHFVGRAANGGLVYGAFADSIKVKMAQFGTTGGTSTNNCISQTLRVRHNFDMNRFRIVVHAASGAVGSISRSDTAFHVQDLGSGLWAIYGTKSMTTNIDWTNLAVFKIFGSCSPSNPQYVSLLVDTQMVYSTTGTDSSEFTCTPSLGTATITCQGLCPEIGKPVVDETLQPSLPTVFALRQNFPNPFNPTTTISLSLPVKSDWKITIYNITGQVLKSYSGTDEAGDVEVRWDASNYASGVYLYRAEAGSFTQTRKMLLIK